MPIHFSIGFVIESSPKRPYVAVCASVVGDVHLKAKCDNKIEIRACWPREDSCK